MPEGGQEWEGKEEARNTPKVDAEGNVLSIQDLEWQVGVDTTLWSTVDFVHGSGRRRKVSSGNSGGVSQTDFEHHFDFVV